MLSAYAYTNTGRNKIQKKKTSDDRYRDVTRSLVVAGFSHARAPVAQLVRASDWNSEDPGPNPGWISMSFSPTILHVALLTTLCFNFHNLYRTSYSFPSVQQGSSSGQ